MIYRTSSEQPCEVNRKSFKPLVTVSKPTYLVYLAFLSGIIVYSYSVLLGGDFGANKRMDSSVDWYKVSPEMLLVARRLHVEDRVSSSCKCTKNVTRFSLTC